MKVAAFTLGAPLCPPSEACPRWRSEYGARSRTPRGVKLGGNMQSQLPIAPTHIKVRMPGLRFSPTP